MLGVHNLGSITLACTPWSRARGLLGRSEVDGVLLLVPCKDIHTIGMKRAIDVAFLDEKGCVLASRRSLGAGKRMKCRGAHAVLERVARTDAPWPAPGDQSCSFFHAKSQKEQGHQLERGKEGR